MKLFLVLLLCTLPIAAKAQDIPSKPKPKFLNKKNLAIITMAAVSTAADGYTTQKFFANPRTYEINPLAGMFGKSRGASAGLAFHRVCF